MWHETLAQAPGFMRNFREHGIEHRSLAAAMLVAPVGSSCPVARPAPAGGSPKSSPLIPLDQGVLVQFPERFVEIELVLTTGFNTGRGRGSLHNHGLRNTIWVQQSQQAEQTRLQQDCLLDLLKRERPGRCHRFRLPGGILTAHA